MENQFYLDQLEKLKAIPGDKVKEPTMPVDVFLQEAENLWHWVQQDKEALVKAGLKWEMVEELQVRTSVLRHAQGIWNKELNSRKEAERLWSEKSPDAYALRDDIVHSCHYAYRNSPAQKEQTRRVQEGSGGADMVQDLVNLAYIGNSNAEPLQAINFDFTLLEKGVEVAEEMADLLAQVNGEKGSTQEAKLNRDKAFGQVKEVVDEIRDCGKFVFWRTPERLKGYSSAYKR